MYFVLKSIKCAAQARHFRSQPLEQFTQALLGNDFEVFFEIRVCNPVREIIKLRTAFLYNHPQIGEKIRRVERLLA